LGEALTLSEWLESGPSIIHIYVWKGDRRDILYGSWIKDFECFVFDSSMCEYREKVVIPLSNPVFISDSVAKTEDMLGRMVELVF
jgi:hypothetical protein